ncbi:hypothetical protein GGD61_008281 [Bradyrhizobium sp. SBR1B]|nr:hypothetical protein [Bradyrhizobium sp. SBR1B]
MHCAAGRSNIIVMQTRQIGLNRPGIAGGHLV